MALGVFPARLPSFRLTVPEIAAPEAVVERDESVDVDRDQELDRAAREAQEGSVHLRFPALSRSADVRARPPAPPPQRVGPPLKMSLRFGPFQEGKDDPRSPIQDLHLVLRRSEQQQVL